MRRDRREWAHITEPVGVGFDPMAAEAGYLLPRAGGVPAGSVAAAADPE